MSTQLASTAWEWRAMGTTWRIYHDGCVSAAASSEVAALVDADEQRWSRFRPNSELSRINAWAGLPVDLSDETLELLIAARDHTRETGGAFQPLVGDRMVAWGYEHSLSVMAPGTTSSPGPAAITSTMRLDTARKRVIVPRGAALDLGGIAKSWSAVRAGRLLRASSRGSVLLEAGGDIVAVSGDHIVVVECTGERVMLREGEGVATSGYGRRQWRNGDGIAAHHLIDPQSGAPAKRSHATVIAADAVTADVLATALAVRPPLIEQRSEACQVIDELGARRSTPRWTEVAA